MNKSELKKVIAEQEEISQTLAEKYINAVFEGIKTGLITDGKVSIHGSITLEVKPTNASSGVLNGIEWSKEAGKKVSAKVSKTFEAEVVGE